MRETTKAWIATAAIALLIVGVASTVFLLQGGSGGKKLASPTTRLQTYLTNHATAKVLSVKVVRCADVTSRLISGRARAKYANAYACPVEVSTTQGSGCVGVVYARGIDDTVVVVVQPKAVDPRYCQ